MDSIRSLSLDGIPQGSGSLYFVFRAFGRACSSLLHVLRDGRVVTGLATVLGTLTREVHSIFRPDRALLFFFSSHEIYERWRAFRADRNAEEQQRGPGIRASVTNVREERLRGGRAERCRTSRRSVRRIQEDSSREDEAGRERDDTPWTIAYVLWPVVTRKRATGLPRWAGPPDTRGRAIGPRAEQPPRLHSR